MYLNNLMGTERRKCCSGWPSTLGLRQVRYPQPSQRLDVVDRSNPFFTFDNAACISCARCVRACDEIQGTHALTMLNRGFAARPVAGAAALFGDAAGFASSNCVSCGACVKECPTGALMEKTVIEQGPPEQTVRTTCAYCGVGCSFEAGVRDGKVVKMVPADDGAFEFRPCLHEGTVRLDL